MRVGQHPRMVGQHKTEWWVNMEQNLQSDEAFQYSGPIHLFTNPYSKQPFFELNKVIDNQRFDCVTDLSAVNKVVVKIELIQFQNIIEPFVLNFNIH